MAARKGRSPVAASITQQSIEDATSALSTLPEKQKTHWSLREAVHQLQGTINTALERGYSYPEVADMLGEQGIRISPTSLRSYLAASSRDAAAPPKQRRTAAKATVSEAVSTVPSPTPEVESVPEATSAPKKTRTSRTASNAKTPVLSRGKKAATEPATPRTRRKNSTTATAP